MGTLSAPQLQQQHQKHQQKQQQHPARAPAAGPMLLLFLLVFLLLLLLLGGWKCSHTPPRNSSWVLFFPQLFLGVILISRSAQYQLYLASG